MGTAGEWLEKALNELCQKMESGLQLDGEVISGLVSYCELAPPQDAKEYLDNIIGQQAGKNVIEEYLRRRGYSELPGGIPDAPSSKLHTYVKPPSNEVSVTGTKKPLKQRDAIAASSNKLKTRAPMEATEPRNAHGGNQGNTGKKKVGKVVSLAEAAKGSIVFRQGKPCPCQARRHKLVSNCLSCGKIVCEQEGEGPCSFCGALVLREGSTYAGLDVSVAPLSEAEAEAEAYAKRLVDYDQNSAARTLVIDDQSDYYEGNSWLSMEENELLRKKREEIEEAERVRRSKVLVTFDLVGRKIVLNKDEAAELVSESRALGPPDGRQAPRITPNRAIKVQPIFTDPGPIKRPNKHKQPDWRLSNGLCLEITGKVQHDANELKILCDD